MGHQELPKFFGFGALSPRMRTFGEPSLFLPSPGWQFSGCRGKIRSYQYWGLRFPQVSNVASQLMDGVTNVPGLAALLHFADKKIGFSGHIYACRNVNPRIGC